MECIVYGKGIISSDIPPFEINTMAPSLLAEVEKAFQDPNFSAKFKNWQKERNEKECNISQSSTASTVPNAVQRNNQTVI